MAEVLGAGLLGEQVVSTFEHARRELLVAAPEIIPDKARVFLQLTEAESICFESKVMSHGVLGFGLSLFNEFSPLTYQQKSMKEHDYRALTEPFTLFELDFHDAIPEIRGEFDLIPHTSGCGDGIMLWYELDLMPGRQPSTSPYEPP